MSDPAVQRIVDELAPATWSVSVWPHAQPQTFVNGRIDIADVHRIVKAVLAEVFEHHRAVQPCRRCGALVILAVHDSGHPMPLEPEPDPTGFMGVWREDGWMRTSGAPAQDDGRRYVVHHCGG